MAEATAVCAEVVAAAKAADREEPLTLPLVMDVCDRDSINAAASAVEDAWGQLDILVNNAGYLAPLIPLGNGDEEDWWRTLEVNVRGMYWVTKSLLPLLFKGVDKAG